MGEFSETLRPSGEILYRTSVAPIFKIRIWLLLFALLGLTGWAAVSYPDLVTWPYVAGAVALAVFLCFRAIIPLWTLKIAVSEVGVIVQRGWIAQTNQEMELKNIEEVNVDQSLFGRLFGYGAIQIRGTGVNSIVLQWIAAPYELRRAIEQAIQRQTGPSAEASGIPKRATGGEEHFRLV
jgi:uncharacterized membrane protein YdbT with pleckstrin-like domain